MPNRPIGLTTRPGPFQERQLGSADVRRSALCAYPYRHRMTAMLGVPLGSRAAHVMEFGAIGIKQACHHVMHAVCELCQEAPAARGRRYGLPAHDPLRRFLMTGDRCAPLSSPHGAPGSIAIIEPNLLKISTNSSVISILSATVAKKLRRQLTE
jgi:hypothetical protein